MKAWDAWGPPEPAAEARIRFWNMDFDEIQKLHIWCGEHVLNPFNRGHRLKQRWNTVSLISYAWTHKNPHWFLKYTIIPTKINTWSTKLANWWLVHGVSAGLTQKAPQYSVAGSQPLPVPSCPTRARDRLFAKKSFFSTFDLFDTVLWCQLLHSGWACIVSQMYHGTYNM